jgi:UDP-N-acetylglucosamine 4,6-dehydratase
MPDLDLKGRTILITGGTGSFGRACTQRLLEEHDPAAIRIFSRDELKQSEMRADFLDDPRLRFLLGDVRDLNRLRLAFRGVDVVVHAAALKQVPACEYNPFEAVQTNIIGAENVLRAAIDTGVSRVMALSTDKAVNPANLYGATKLCAEKVFVQAQAYAGDMATRFACVRYGNVVGSRGSVVLLFLRQAKSGVITITDERMTRFWITLDQAVTFVIAKIAEMQGGEVFVPKIPSMSLSKIAGLIAPDADRKVIGIRAGEKMHELLLTKDESRHAIEKEDSFVILPLLPNVPEHDGDPLPEDFEFRSDNNPQWLSDREFLDFLEDLKRHVPE